jgi:hypothetical protein
MALQICKTTSRNIPTELKKLETLEIQDINNKKNTVGIYYVNVIYKYL